MRFPHVLLAGTFDGLHAGHRALLARAFEEGEKVTIGLTSDLFVRTYKLVQLVKLDQLVIRPYAERKKALENWLMAQKLYARAATIPISDPYEPAASMTDLDGLIVTAKNRKRGEHINALRQALGLSPLALIEVSMMSAEDGAPISSTRMRNGEIDHNGRLVMPESLRAVLGKPLGKVLSGGAVDRAIRRNRDKVVITVGDVATKTFLDAGVIPTLAIIDGKVGRKPYAEAYESLKTKARLWGTLKPGFVKVKSGPGFISREAAEAIHSALAIQARPAKPATHHALIIDGEEDLLVLPAILHASIGSILYYGQPREGLVEVLVTEEKKKQVVALLGEFT